MALDGYSGPDWTEASGLSTLAIDFDGVLHKYSKGYHDGTLYDDPIEGALDAIKTLLESGYSLVIYTARRNLEDVQKWLQDWGFPPLEVTNNKPHAVAYIDDRAVRFTNWNDIRKMYC